MSFCQTIIEQGVSKVLEIYHDHFFYIKAIIKLTTASCQKKIELLMDHDRTPSAPEIPDDNVGTRRVLMQQNKFHRRINNLIN